MKLRPRNKLVSYIDRYYNSDKSKYSIALFDKCEPFVYNYKPECDVVFMDIGLPGISGMEAAAAIRKTDPVVVIIFVTSLAQYAVKGYEVSAFDFVVKPVGYAEFEMKFRRAELTVNSRKDCEIVVTERAERAPACFPTT